MTLVSEHRFVTRTGELRERLENSLGDVFAIERELGGGGMSRVFLARERALDRQVVVKVLHPELAGVNVDRFRREIQVVAQLQHPHIVPVLATGEADGILYFTMPYIDGESLRAWLLRESRLSIDDTVRVLHDVAGRLHRRPATVRRRHVVRRSASRLIRRVGLAREQVDVLVPLVRRRTRRSSSSWAARSTDRH